MPPIEVGSAAERLPPQSPSLASSSSVIDVEALVKHASFEQLAALGLKVQSLGVAKGPTPLLQSKRSREEVP